MVGNIRGEKSPLFDKTRASVGKSPPFLNRRHTKEARAKIGVKRGSRLSGEEQVAKAEAQSHGELWYFHPRPCRKGHISKRSVKHGCCYSCERQRVRATYHQQSNEDPSFMLYHSAQQRAKQEGTIFKLTREDIRAVWPVDGVCPVLGIQLERRSVTSDNSATLDRIDWSRGYVPGNIAVISYRANRIKQRIDDPEVFERLATWLEFPDSSEVGSSYHTCTTPVYRCSCRRMCDTARVTASSKQLPFAITVDDIRSVWPVANRCPILGIEMRRSSRSGPNPTSPSLDKRIPSLGYTPGNIAVISHLANRVKNNETDPVVFRRLAVWLRACKESSHNQAE